MEKLDQAQINAQLLGRAIQNEAAMINLTEMMIRIYAKIMDRPEADVRENVIKNTDKTRSEIVAKIIEL